MKVGILGGGILGLTAAYSLAQRGDQVTLFEKEPELGGLSSAFRVQGTYLERYHHYVIRSDRFLLGLLEELGLGNRVKWQDTRTGFFVDRLYPFTSPLDLITFSPLSLGDRLRCGWAALSLAGERRWQDMEQVSVEEWWTQKAGRAVYQTVWSHLVEMKFGKAGPRTPISWLWARCLREASSWAKFRFRERFAYVEGTFKVLIDALEEKIKGLGGEVFTDRPVDRILVEGGRASGLVAQGQSFTFDKIVATIPLPSLLPMVPEFPRSYVERMEKIQYQAILNMILVLKRPFTHYFWLNMSPSDIPFPAIIEFTNLRPREDFQGRSILYIPNYMSEDHELWQLPEGELLARYTAAMARISPNFTKDHIESHHIFRNRYADPFYTINYSHLMPGFLTAISDLYLANTTQIYPETRSANNSIRLGKMVPRIIDKGISNKFDYYPVTLEWILGGEDCLEDNRVSA